MSQVIKKTARPSEHIALFLCGDVMTGRGIDQVLPYPSDPALYEPYVRNAKEYVAIAEEANGPIPKPVNFSYIWGDGLKELQRMAPDVRIINLETSVTTSDEFWQGKGIHYRMHPKNIPCISAAKIDCCVLANNHVLDWGYKGLSETLSTLRGASLNTAGAGNTSQEAKAPAVLEVAGKGRVIIFSFGIESSGIPLEWAASADRPGVNLLPDLSARTIARVKDEVQAATRPGDIIVASIHWGGNWGYHVPRQHVWFAHKLIDSAGVDIIHGHSSHHAMGIEVYKDKPIIYGCGDFLNDYEGIRGHEEYRGDLALMYFIGIVPASGQCVSLKIVPSQIRHFRLNQVSRADALWLTETLSKESKKFNTDVALTKENNLIVSAIK